MTGESTDLDALVALAQRERGAGRLAAAAAAYRQILTIAPDYVEVHFNLGNVLLDQGLLDEAAAQYLQALALHPNLFQAHNNLGNILRQQGKFDQAAAEYQRAIALWPDYAEAHYNLAVVLRNQGQLDQALARYEQALALRPDFAEAANSLGNLLLSQGRLDEAAPRYEQALAARPRYAEARYNLGTVRLHQNKLAEAEASYQQALDLRPDYAEAQMGLATCYLAKGDFEHGWPAYERRLRIPGFVPLPSLPRWTGQSLAGRSLLLLAEQGLGDTLQFVRYAQLFKKRGARVVLATQAPLGRLLASQSGVDELFILGSAVDWPRADFYLPLLSSPFALGTTTSTIPCDVPYLWADPELTNRWRQELAEIDGFKIAVVWQGARSFPLDCLRSIPLADFAPLAKLPGVRLLSLQKGYGSEQLATVGFPVVDLSDRLDEVAGPFMDTAAVIRNVDLVVAPNTAIAHLAGALGAPVWVAQPFSPDWRWPQGRDDSAWYPTLRLFRQTTVGRWSDVFERMANAVQARRAETG